MGIGHFGCVLLVLSSVTWVDDEGPSSIVGVIGEALALAAMPAMALALATGTGRVRRRPSARRCRRGIEWDTGSTIVRLRASPTGALLVLGLVLTFFEGGANYLWPGGWARYSPALWVAMASALIALLVAAFRASRRPTPEPV
jgi:hypothetical protein